MSKIDMDDVSIYLGNAVATMALIIEGMDNELYALNKYGAKDDHVFASKNFAARVDTAYKPALDLLFISLRNLHEAVDAATT